MALSPTPLLDPVAGLKALEEDLPRVLKALGASSIEELGWVRSHPLTLLVPLEAQRNGQTDFFLLRLGFHAYREWPPSAQFVNPDTHDYRAPEDHHHVPQLTSTACNTHLSYPRPSGGVTQLICCSATFEFYDVQHNVRPEHEWNRRYSFLTTLRAIQRAMHTSYQGRFPRGQ